MIGTFLLIVIVGTGVDAAVWPKAHEYLLQAEHATFTSSGACEAAKRMLLDEARHQAANLKATGYMPTLAICVSVPPRPPLTFYKKAV